MSDHIIKFLERSTIILAPLSGLIVLHYMFPTFHI